MNEAIVRLEDIIIKNIKNVEWGHINLDNHKSKYASSVLGLYGQNGSGKTVLINAIDILKQLLMGQKLSSHFVDYINLNSDTAELSFEFSIVVSDLTIRAYYDIELGRQSDSIDNTTDVIQTLPQSVQVIKEKLQYKVINHDASVRKNTIIDTDTNAVFKPNAKFKLLFGESYSDITDFLVDKRLSKVESRSFIFSPRFIKRLLSTVDSHKDNQEARLIIHIIMSLVNYGNHDLYVVSTSHSGLNSLNILPLEINLHQGNIGRIGTITIPLDGSVILPEFVVHDIDEIINMMNLVLSEIIPGLTIAKKELGTELMEDGQVGRRISLLSNKNEKSIPLKYESEGIRKIISILSLLISVFNRKSITVAIDELDAGIFEYLLGELLRIITEHGKGQLLFTSHNLRPLETLDKACIAFTTTNSKNRYIRLAHVKTSNNLRDFYYRDITLGEQEEEVYKPTCNADISFAFKKAGRFNWRERK